MKIKYIFFLALIVGLAFTSCREDQDEIIEENPIYNPKIKVEASVFGVVTNIEQEPVEGAFVTYDGKTKTTDAHGVFRFENESLYEDGTYISVKKEGYFKGSRRFYPKVGKESRVGIELMPLTIIDQIESTAASKVKFENVELDFSANSIVTESGGAYTGTVNIAARYLDPTKISTLNQMPGDLAGFTDTEEVVSLVSLGMIAVELMDDNGNELQLKEGSPVSAIIPIPDELLDNAPAKIPLWHFDEEMGIWVEEGEAMKVGNHYEGLLPHFSFWNCDYPGELVCISGTILNRGIHASGIQVVFSTSLGVTGSGYTDGNGFFTGKIPANEELTFELVNACGDVIYSTTLGPFTDDTVLDPININEFVDMVNISGSVASCDDGPPPSDYTYVVVKVGGLETIINLEDNDTFNGVTMYCNSTDEIEIYAYDALNAMTSGMSTYTINGDIVVGELILCDENYSEQFIYKYGDNVIKVTSAADPVITKIYTYVTAPAGNQTVFTFTLLDWNSDQTVTISFLYEEGIPLKPITFEVLNESFKAHGEGTSQLVEQDGIEYYVFRGSLTDIENKDGTIYTGDYTEVEYSIVVPK
jgi:hypothetical protein